MTEQVKINPDLSIILVGSVINKCISEYEGDLSDNRASIPVEEFITQLNDTTRKYTQDFPNDEINFPQIDIKLLSFIINRTLYFKFVSVANNHVIVEVGDRYENYLKNIVATSTFRYSKFLLNGAKSLYKSEQEGNKGVGVEEVTETTEEVKDMESAEQSVESTENVADKEQQVSDSKEDNIESDDATGAASKGQDTKDIEGTKDIEDTEVVVVTEETKNHETEEIGAADGVELASPEIEELSQVDGKPSSATEMETKDTSQSVGSKQAQDNKDDIIQTDVGVEKEQLSQKDDPPESDGETALEENTAKAESKAAAFADEVVEGNEEEKSSEVSEGEVKDTASAVVDVTGEQKELGVKKDSEKRSNADDNSEEGTNNVSASGDRAVSESSSPTPVESETHEPPAQEKSIDTTSPQLQPLPSTKSEPLSRKRPRSQSPAPTQHRKRFQNIAVNLINSIQEHRFSSPFLQAVNPKDAPNYYEMIYEPRNLKGILKALKSKADPPVYSSIKELERDVMLMFANCIMYNRPDEDLVELTRTMKRDVGDMFKMFKEAESEIK
ncbi:hypothetical protein KGF57_000838 [Candida theae]|uniref:Bromo domain-containing protein n=1 Tax=Candida theae TaxID=1198502 RepID=A0AAD5BI30_9ASCO|nr:uncharacterized protein KGF57_000838 [Candida theae]KAI5965045.1 hypothetical protein KGF57_000838 [Candida theae]